VVAMRAAALVGLALVGGVLALALTSGRESRARPLPRAVGAYSALAASTGVTAYGKKTACGQIIGATTQGVAHPVLPCGVKIYLTYAGRSVLTQVIDHGPSVPGHAFELTQALAKRIGLVGVQRITWSYAGTK